MNKALFTLMMLFFMSFQIVAQKQAVSGTVSDEDNLPVPGASILIKGTTSGTMTDLDGKFSLSVSKKDTLVISFIGYKTQEILVGDQTTFSIQLAVEESVLGEVLVVAYGFADKRSYTGSVSEVNGEDLEKRPLTNATGALIGTVAGLQTNSVSGQPGSAPDIRIRGFGSFSSSSSPLYVVDGVPYTQGISNINPNDIESFSVLKDASATSLYGSRAANGVVIITTKQGKKGEAKVDFKVLRGVTSRAIPEYERVNAKQYYPLMWEAYRNSLTTPLATANQTATDDISGLLGYNPFNVPGNEVVLTNGQLNPNAELLYDDFDWFDALSRTGTREEYNLSFSGSNEKTDYFISMGYVNEEGYIINSDFKRYAGRINVNSQVKSWLKTGVNLSLTYSEGNNAQTSGSSSFVNPFNFARNLGPIYPVFEHDPVTGAFILDSEGNKIYDLGFGPPARPSGASPGRHVVQETLLNKDFYKRTVSSVRTYGEASFLKDFKFRVNAAVDLYSIYSSTYDNKIVGDGAPAGRASRLSSTETSVTLNQLLTYDRTFNDKHTVNVLVGHESFFFEDHGFSGSRQEQIVDGIDELVNFTTTNNLTSSTFDRSIESYFTKVGYDYDEKYFISASYRRDGSSRFAKPSRWGGFFSLGVSWRLENEPFMKNIEWVNALKLRSSIGQVGNEAVQNNGVANFYASQGLYELGFNNADEPGYLQSTLSNELLGWEVNTSLM